MTEYALTAEVPGVEEYRALRVAAGRFRAVTHLDVPEPLIDEALARLQEAQETSDL